MIEPSCTKEHQAPAIDKRLFAVKAIHTLIWAVFVAIISFILWSGVTGNISRYSWLAVAAVIGEGLVLIIFKGSCPLTLVAKRYSESSRENFDIFLPRWLAKYNKVIFGSLAGIGAALMIYKSLP
jgi:hypothetical protein